MLFYNALDLNNQKILWLPSIFQFERKVGFWTTLPIKLDISVSFKTIPFRYFNFVLMWYLSWDQNDLHQKKWWQRTLTSFILSGSFLLKYSNTTLETIWPHSGSNSFPALHNYMTPIHLILKRSIRYVICSKSGHSCPAAWFLLDSYAVKKANPDHRPVTTGLEFFLKEHDFLINYS